jgi:hypothetical protein
MRGTTFFQRLARLCFDERGPRGEPTSRGKNKRDCPCCVVPEVRAGDLRPLSADVAVAGGGAGRDPGGVCSRAHARAGFPNDEDALRYLYRVSTNVCLNQIREVKVHTRAAASLRAAALVVGIDGGAARGSRIRCGRPGPLWRGRRERGGHALRGWHVAGRDRRNPGDHKANGVQSTAQGCENRSGLAGHTRARWGNDEEGGKRMTDCVPHLELAAMGGQAQRLSDPRMRAPTCALAIGVRCVGGVGLGPPGAAGIDPEAQSLRAARAILARVAERRRKAWWRFVVPLALTPVAAAAMLLLVVTRGAPAPRCRTRSLVPRGTSRALCAARAPCWSRRSANAVTACFRSRMATISGGRPPALRLHQGPSRRVAGVRRRRRGRLFPYYRDDALAGVTRPARGRGHAARVRGT